MMLMSMEMVNVSTIYSVHEKKQYYGIVPEKGLLFECYLGTKCMLDPSTKPNMDNPIEACVACVD